MQARHRKAAKAKMAAAADDFYQAVYNAEQLAYKLGGSVADGRAQQAG